MYKFVFSLFPYDFFQGQQNCLKEKSNLHYYDYIKGTVEVTGEEWKWEKNS